MFLRSIARCSWSALFAALLTVQAAASGTAHAPPAPIWTGVYAGIHGGYAWADVSYTFNTFIPPETFDHGMGGGFVGGQVGAQRQFGNAVVGLEVSYSGVHLTDTIESVLLPGRYRQIDIDSLFMITARLGYATDRWMAYVKGGFASADVSTRVFMPGRGPGSFTSDTVGGWTVGAGVEVIRWRNFRLGLEYNYVHLNIGDRAGLLPDDKPFTYTNFDNDIHTVTLRLSYLFGNDFVEPLK